MRLTGIIPVIIASVFAGSPLTLRMELQDTTTTWRAEWSAYQQPTGDIRYVWWVTDELTSAEVYRDTTTEKQTTEWTHARTDVDQEFRFHLEVYLVSNGTWYASGAPFSTRYLVPKLEPWTLLTASSNVTSPELIADRPEFQQDEGTLWLEFTPTADLSTVQGLWSRDASGYGGGGHLSIMIRNGVLEARIQDLAASYSVTGAIAPSQVNQAAVTFGPTGFKLYVNGAIADSSTYTGGTVGTDGLALSVGALRWDWKPTDAPDSVSNPFLGAIATAEYYRGLYDFSNRWGEGPVIPPPPVCDTCVNVIRVGMIRLYFNPDDSTKWVQLWTAPATYRLVDHRIGQDTTYHYEVWIDGAKVGYNMDANYGVVECWRAGHGEVCPVRPFRGVGREPLLLRGHEDPRGERELPALRLLRERSGPYLDGQLRGHRTA